MPAVRVTFVIPSLTVGGAEVFLLDLVSALAARPGMHVALVNLNRTPASVGIEARVDPRVTYVKPNRIIARSASLLTRFLRKHAQTFRPDVINSHLYHADRIVAVCPVDVARVFSEHGDYRGAARAQRLATLAHADLVICAAWCNEQLLGEHDISHTQTIHYGLMRAPCEDPASANGSDAAHQHVSRCDVGLRDDQFVFCMAARGIIEKGWCAAVEAIIALGRGEEVALLMLGQGPGVGQARQMARDHGVDHVKFVGQVDQVRPYMRLADAGLLPSCFVSESYPVALLEALYEGKPIVGTDTGGIAEMIEQSAGAVGVLCPVLPGQPPDPDELARCMAQLIDQYDLLCSNVVASHAYLGIERCADEYVRAFDAVIARRASR